jgi:hypothetical protein
MFVYKIRIFKICVKELVIKISTLNSTSFGAKINGSIKTLLDSLCCNQLTTFEANLHIYK